jgi:hypothetical protein
VVGYAHAAFFVLAFRARIIFAAYAIDTGFVRGAFQQALITNLFRVGATGTACQGVTIKI